MATTPSLHFPARLTDAALSSLCQFMPATRYATPSGHGYMPLATIAAHRRLRRVAEGADTAGFGLFFFTHPKDAEEAKEDRDADRTAAQPPPACRGLFFLREEDDNVSRLQQPPDPETASPPSSSVRYLTITAAPPSLLEEYLPLVKWWLPSRYAALPTDQATAPATRGSVSPGEGTAPQPVTSLQLFLRDATNAEQASQRQGTDAALARQRTYTALAVYNSVCLLSSLPLSASFAGLTYLKLVHFPMSSLLWDAVAKAGRTLTVLNLSCCTGFTDPLAVQAMQQLVKCEAGEVDVTDGDKSSLRARAPPSSALAVGALPHLQALLLPATDGTNATLRTLIAATAPYHKLAYVNVGECDLVSDLSSLVLLKGSLQCLHAYSLPRLEPALALEAIARCGADTLHTLSLSRCTTLVEVRHLSRLRRLQCLDLQGCTALTSLSGLFTGMKSAAADANLQGTASAPAPAAVGEGCAALEKLWLTGCTALKLSPEDQAALFACCPRLQDLQLGHTDATGAVLTLPSPSCPSLRSLALSQCSALKGIVQLAPPPTTAAASSLPSLAMLDLSSTQVTTSVLASLLLGSGARKREGGVGGCQAPCLHTLALNGCRSISDFAFLAGLPALKRLSLSGTHVTSAHLEDIAAGCQRLQVLNLNYCEDVVSFTVFPRFRALRVLALAHTKTTNTALQSLLNIPFLQVLSLQETAVTDLLKLAKAPYLRLVECASTRKTLKNAAQLTKAGIKVDTQAAAPPLTPPMAFVS